MFTRGVLLVVFVLTLQVAAQSGKFFHLSDWHVDPYYIPTKTPSTHCHNITEFIPPLYPIPDRYFNERDLDKLFAEGSPNYNFGQYGCDSTFALVQTALQSMQTTLPNPDFILYSGDMSAHDLPTPESRTVSINDTTVAIRQAYPGVPFYPSLGNNDCYPDYHLAYHKGLANDWLKNVWKIWSNFADIPVDQEHNFIHGGFYSANLNETIVLLSLNTIYWCTGHSPSWTPDQEPDPGAQFQWLNETLQSAAASSKFVYILGHIPPGTGWYQEYLTNYVSIISPYQDIIVAQFFGHTHRDEFHLIVDSNYTNSPFGFYIQAPSLTPKNDNNPSYRIVEYDPSSWEVLDHYQYICDLLQLQRTSAAKWVLEYQFGKLYDVSSVTLDSLREVIDKIQTNTILFNAWNENYDTQYTSPSTRLSTLCKMYYIFSGDVSECEGNGAYQEDPYLNPQDIY